MSYARFGEGGSHVYVFGTGDGEWECCACALQQPTASQTENDDGYTERVLPKWSSKRDLKDVQ